MKKLATREKVTVGIGAAIVVGVLLWRAPVVLGGGGSADGETVAGQIEQIEELDRLHTSVAAASKELHVKVPEVSPVEQMVALRADLTKQVQQAGVQMTVMDAVETTVPGGAVSGAARPVQLRLEMSGRFDNFMKLINQLELADTPYTLREVHFDSGSAPQGGGGPGGVPGGRGGGPSGGGGGGGGGNVRATMRVQSYIFPEVIYPKATPTPAPGAAGANGQPGRAGQAAGQAAGQPGAVNQSGQVTPGGQPGQSGTAAPGGETATPAGRRGGRRAGAADASSGAGWRAAGTPNIPVMTPSGGTMAPSAASSQPVINFSSEVAR